MTYGGLYPRMIALGFTDEPMWLFNTGHFILDDAGNLQPYEIPLRRWTCRCGKHSVEVHDALYARFTDRQRSELLAMVLCHQKAAASPDDQESGEASRGTSDSTVLRVHGTTNSEHINFGAKRDRGQS